MCGICGILCSSNTSYDGRAVIAAMNEHMKDRGPDARGVWSDPARPVVFGHVRLAIQDLSANGAQPMLSHSGRSVMVYNGEVYNAADLKADLAGTDCGTFRGTSDTEILLEHAEAFGLDKTLARAVGMFAIAFYDLSSGTLSLARDRVGEKPLYYGFSGDAFAFASDVGAFREIPGFSAKIRREVLPFYFSHGYIPAPYSVYEDVWKLEPGSILTIQFPYAHFDPKKDGDLAWYYKQEQAGAQNASSGHAFTLFYSMKETAKKGQSHPFTGTKKEAAEELERRLKKAIQGQMISDVPLGAFLSAGIDSSTIVSLMQAVSPGTVQTYTIGMEDPRYNEAEIAGQIAGILGTRHTRMDITEQDAKNVIPLLPGMFGEPFADSSQIPTYLVSKLTRQHVTVALSGDAGDELFAGYTSYRSIERIWGKIGRFPAGLRQAASAVLKGAAKGDTAKVKDALLRASSPHDLHMIEQDPWNLGGRLVRNSGIIRPAEYPAGFCYTGNTLQGDPHLSPLRETMLTDLLLYHPDDILAKVDRTAMAVSLETRVPFLDRDVIAFAWSLPDDYLRDDTRGKLVLRDILYQYVPKELMDRPKKGFSIPIDQWLLEEPLRSWAEDLLSPERIKRQGILDEAEVTALWQAFKGGAEWKPQVWYVLMFQQWLQETGLG
ncbi:MAG: asparagine synthase (glutamine-hydrolyzing) [Lachnospiraceae bacterium]